MFESNTDVDFGDDFTLNFEKFVENRKNKRPLHPPQSEIVKKIKRPDLPKSGIKRKFPGPAGILPDRKERNVGSLQDTTDKNQEEIPCSQMSLSVFQSSPWTDMIRDYSNLTDKYDIRWVKNSASLNKLPNQKAPFLAAIIKSIECSEGKNLIVKVVLKDVSGEIQGTIIHSLYEQYSDSLVPGSVIVLKQFGILTTAYSNNHYLTIAPKNLETIYQKTEDEVVVIKLKVPEVEKSVGVDEGKENLRPKSDSEGKASQEELKAWEEALEGLDMDLFLEDF